MPTSNRKPPTPVESTRQLLADLLDHLDFRLSRFRVNSVLAEARISDTLIFIDISRGTETIPELAALRNISRQAVHSSAQRLININVISCEPLPGRKRDIRLTITPLGREVLKRGAKELRATEAEIAKILGGKAAFDRWRNQLTTLREHFVQQRSKTMNWCR